MAKADRLRAGQRLGKYRIEGRITEGGFAAVYRAFDTIEGIRVALKVPHARLLTAETRELFRKEVRLAARLEHPNILPVKDASEIAGRFVVVFALGERSLADRLRHRLSAAKALDYAEQMLRAVACAHRHRIVHCDVKPDNFILFPPDRLRLTDFGIARVARRTLEASGTGTLGYMAPEQAMGKPSPRSDVFSLGLILYRMFTGHLPEWPYAWPPPRADRLRRKLRPEMAALVRRAMEPEPRRRFPDAEAMLRAFRRLRRRALKGAAPARRRRRATGTTGRWLEVRRREFQRRFRKALGTRHACRRCGGPVAEAMRWCPWCGTERKVHRGPTPFPERCPRCGRGVKRDWRFCPWCWGGSIAEPPERTYPDRRYVARCAGCGARALMPFMRYCPRCRTKVRRRWRVPGSKDVCRACGRGVAADFWSRCPWCGKALKAT